MRQGVCSVLGPDRVHPLRYLSALLVSIVFISMVHAQGRQQPIRLCVSMLKNSSQEVVNPTWQRDQLIKAFERINKSKDVKKGKAAAIQAIPLASTEEPDTNVRDIGCGFVLHSNLVEVLRLGEPRISVPPPGAIAVGTRTGDPRAHPGDYRTATVEYRRVRAGNPETWPRAWSPGRVNHPRIRWFPSSWTRSPIALPTNYENPIPPRILSCFTLKKYRS
jgi:hypothetical protein